MFNEIKNKLEDIFCEYYLDEIIIYNEVRECNEYLKRINAIKDIFNNVIDRYGLTGIKKLEFVTLDNLYDYLVSHSDDKNIDNDYLVRLICYLDKYEFDRCVDVIARNDNSKLFCDIIDKGIISEDDIKRLVRR